MSGKQNSSSITKFCLNCFCENDDIQLSAYEIQSPTLKAIFKMEQLMLCYICYRLARNAEKFIHSVHNNQLLLQSLDAKAKVSLEAIKQSSHTSIHLTYVTLESINFNGSDPNTVEENQVTKLNIKLEPEFMKNEGVNLDIVGVDDFADNTIVDFEASIKGEDDYPLTLLKQELESEGIRIKCLEKSPKKRRKKEKIELRSKKMGRRLKYLENFCKDSIIEILTISDEQCLEERAEKRLEEDYQNRPYQCDDCVRSFSYRDSFERHMELHSESKGDYECDICKIRQPTQILISQHKLKVHRTRYRCRECGLTRSNQSSIEEHYIAIHAQGQFMCGLCSKGYKRPKSLKKHMMAAHETREKVKCDYCDKDYKCKESLKKHIDRKHITLYVGRPKKLQPHLCQECGASFSAPSLLKKHAIKHSNSKDFYCVECDKSFKTEFSLNHHLKTTLSHAEYSKLPFHCTQCEKRFAIKRDLERHTNRVHLNIKPHQCDQCEKAYINNWSLSQHRRLAHEGYKRPLRYPCSMCEKIFDRRHILKEHMRTHTGERPYQCTKCPAQFSQAGVLRTHDKLIHLNLTRDGRPKASVK